MLAGFFMRFNIRDVLWLTAVVALSTALIVQGIAYNKAIEERDTTYYAGEALIELMRAEGFEIDAPAGVRSRPIRVVRRPSDSN
jgi:hypothetical protein